MKRILLSIALLFCSVFPVFSAEGTSHITSDGTWFKFNGKFYMGSPTPHSNANVQVGVYVLQYRPNDGLGKAWRSDGSFLLCSCSIDEQGGNKMFGTLNFAQFVLYDNGFTDITNQQQPLPKFTVIHISNSLYGYDGDGDGTPDDKDVDPDDPEKKGTDTDKDGIDDENDCDPNDPNNNMTKPNCYRCDDGSAAKDKGSCATSDGNYDVAGQDEPDWDKLKKDMEIFLARLKISYDDLKGINSTPKELVIKYPIKIGSDLSQDSVQWGEHKLNVNPELWDDSVGKDIVREWMPVIRGFMKAFFWLIFMSKVMKLVYTN